MDQLKAALKEAALPIAQFYKTLIDERLPSEAALALTLEVQRRLFDPNQQGNPK